MRLQLFSLVSSLLFFSTSVLADTAFIYYKNSGDYNTSSQYTNLKSELEDLGYTVSSSTSGTVSSTDVSGKDLVIDITGSSNCGSNCKTVYDNYVSGGGELLIVGSNGATNRNSNIEQLIESKMSVGSFTQAGGCNACYYSVRKGDYASSTTSENTLPGSDKYMYNVTNGTTVAANSSSNNNIPIMHKWDYGSNGGSVYVTFGYGQFLSTHTYAANMDALLMSIMIEEGLYTSTVQSGITSNQTTEFNAARNKSISGNQLYITQTGNNNTLNILQDGDDNLIIGSDLTSTAVITGDNNALDLDQIGNDNILGLDIIGSSNNVAVTQNQDQRAILDILGSTNNVDLDQSAINYVGEHYMNVKIVGSNNNVDVDQTETGDKKLWLDIDSSNNVAVDQKGTGNHFLDITLTDSHSVDVTQDGSGNHNATINLSGNSSSVTLTQDSSTDQNYYLEQNCNSASCSATVTQN
jgi:hypothetical protein